eukprot:39945_1
MSDSGDANLFIPIWILTGFYCLILTPLSLFYLYKFWQLASKNTPFFTKRHPTLVVICGMMPNTYPIILRPIADLTRAHGVLGLENALARLIANTLQWYFLLEYMRLWLLYYDYQYSLHTLALKWKQQILKEETNIPWTHRHRWLGNVKVLFLITAICGPVIILGIILVLVHSPVGQGYVELAEAVVPMMWLLFSLVVAFKVRKCRDEFMIQKEFKIYGIALASAIIEYGIIQIVCAAVGDRNVQILLMNMYTCTCCYLMSFISTHWVIKQYNAQQLRLKVALTRQLSDKSVIDMVKSRWTLEQVLSTKDGFDSFANHLVREFSIENLFFVFEMVQIKNDLVTQGLVDLDDIGVVIAIDFHRVQNLRRNDSHIRNVKEMKRNTEYIVQQYVVYYGEYTVNVSAKTRDTLIAEYERLRQENADKEEMDKEIVKEYIGIFDESMDEIIALMRGDSLTRFYETAEYKMLKDNN